MVDGANDRSSFLSSEPIMNSYGDLYREIQLTRPNFGRAQADAADHVFRALYSFVSQGLISKIVDLGCGNGAVLKELQNRFVATLDNQSGQMDKWLELIGIDSDAQLIEQLEPRRLCGTCLRFMQDDALGIAGTVNDGKTALLVLGHTIFHFTRSRESFRRFLSGLNPIVWVIDCHRTWNEALVNVDDPRGSLEPVWVDKATGRIICLKTSRFDKECVRRGLVRRPDAPDEPTEDLFQTTQIAVNSDDLKKALADLGYLLALSYEYYSSWGPMSSYVFVRDVAEEAKHANDSWYTAVSSALAEVFRSAVLSESENRFVAIRQAVKLYKVRCAAVILPFDQIHTFARYAPLDCGAVDDLDSTGRIWLGDQARVMLLEEPSQDQDKYPTAYGLFTCILGRTSSMQVFPLRLIANYQMAPIDRRFSQYESSFFEGCTAQGDTAESDRAFFLMPVFFGCLPLFVLVLQFGDTFSELDTGPGLFRSCLIDLHQQVREVFDERFLRTRILRPFLRDTYHRLRSSENSLNPRNQNTEELSKSVYTQLEEAVLEHAGYKPWKSWILALPGTLIRDKRTVKEEQVTLARVVRAEIDRLRRDMFFRFSQELEELEFFAADNDQRVAEAEENPHESPTWKHHDIILSKRLDDKSILGSLVDLNNRYEGVVNWTLKRMKLLIKAGGSSQLGNSEAFQDLKAAYCRTLENTGGLFRFSIRRLTCMIEMATGVPVEANVAANCDEEIVVPIDEDPCQGLFEILHDLKAYWKQIPVITLCVCNRNDESGVALQGLSATVNIDFSSALTKGGMGQDSRQLLESLRRWCTAEVLLTEPEQTRILAARLEVGPAVEGASIWRSLHTELQPISGSRL